MKRWVPYVAGPALLMLAMGLVQVYLMPRLFARPWRYQLWWMLPPLVYTGALSRRMWRSGRFLCWAPLATIVAIAAAYAGVAATGVLDIGGHDLYPAAIVMLPTVALLFCVWFSALVVRLLRW